MAERDIFVPRFHPRLLLIAPLLFAARRHACPESKRARGDSPEFKVRRMPRHRRETPKISALRGGLQFVPRQTRRVSASGKTAQALLRELSFQRSAELLAKRPRRWKSKKGNEAAPNCDTCHGVAHEIVSTKTADWKKGHSPTLAPCAHDKEAAEYKTSVHGQAVARGVTAAPVCTDCHTSHSIMRPKNPDSSCLFQ